jgi:polysaccharide export outer membrane protein
MLQGDLSGDSRGLDMTTGPRWKGTPGRSGGLALRCALLIGLSVLACSSPYVKELQPGESVTPITWEFDPSYEYQTEYRIRVGDEIVIEFFSDPDPAEDASRAIVRPDGRISVRGVDDVLAAGKTPAGLDSVLTAGFAKILVDPALSVIITRFAGERVFVLGEVTSPREIPLSGPLTALQAIAASGGFTVKANRSEVVLVRPLGGGRVAAVKLNIERMLTDPGSGQDLALRGQDVLLVPRSTIGKVGDYVELYFKNINPAFITVLTLSEIYQNDLFNSQ